LQTVVDVFEKDHGSDGGSDVEDELAPLVLMTPLECIAPAVRDS
jgi:hypothetical protein